LPQKQLAFNCATFNYSSRKGNRSNILSDMWNFVKFSGRRAEDLLVVVRETPLCWVLV
jgi:hypothetical protein